MELTSRLEEIAGPKGSSRHEALARFQQLGIPVAEQTISLIRASQKGKRTDRRLEERGTLDQGDASKKNSYYIQLLESAKLLRTFKTGDSHPNAFNSLGFTEKVAQEIGVTPHYLERILRAMRLEIICEDLFTNQSKTNEVLKLTVDDFFSDYLVGPPSHISKPQEKLHEIWESSDQRTIAFFYRQMYSIFKSRRSIGKWVPYEIDVLSAFYHSQEEKGNPLTIFDLLILKGEISGKNLSAISDAIKDVTQIPCHLHVLTIHRNILVYSDNKST